MTQEAWDFLNLLCPGCIWEVFCGEYDSANFYLNPSSRNLG